MDVAGLGEEAAPGRCLTLLIIPGFMGTAAIWRPFLSRLDPGIVARFWFPERELGGDAVVALRRRLRQPRRTPLVALGYSQGARVLWAALQDRRARPDGLVLISGRPPISDTLLRARRRSVDRQRAALVRRVGVRRFLESWRTNPVIRSQRGIDAALQARRRAERLRLSPAQVAEALEVLGAGGLSIRESGPVASLPALVIAGANDRPYRVLRLQWAQRLPHLQWIEIDRAGHAPQFERPTVVASHVNRFVQSLARPSTVVTD
ncbi:MAG: alpha/beta fold hydrolase [Candidatus Dadabacteria bacterium]|nr:MAG: alpha/beta fold hydrolase [Candidatus Dadabacteria bacterium]